MKLNQKMLKELILEELEDYMAENNPERIEEIFGLRKSREDKWAEIAAGETPTKSNVVGDIRTGKSRAELAASAGKGIQSQQEAEASAKVMELQKLINMPGTAIDSTTLFLLDRVLSRVRKRSGAGAMPAQPGGAPEEAVPYRPAARRDRPGHVGISGVTSEGLEERDTKQPKQPQKGKKTRGK